MSRRGAGALVAAALLVLTACSEPEAADPPAVPPSVAASAARAASQMPKLQGGVWQPSGWPDACSLLVPAAGFDLGGAVPGSGTLGDGTPMPHAKTCRRTVRAVPAGVELTGSAEVTLTVHLVTEDVWSVWGGVQTLETFIRPIESLGDEAFLTDVGFDNAPERLWLCVGRAIVLVERTRDVLDLQDARTLLLAVGESTERVLRTLPAGQPADPNWRPAQTPST